jgi:hypothetical protein
MQIAGFSRAMRCSMSVAFVCMALMAVGCAQIDFNAVNRLDQRVASRSPRTIKTIVLEYGAFKGAEEFAPAYFDRHLAEALRENGYVVSSAGDNIDVVITISGRAYKKKNGSWLYFFPVFIANFAHYVNGIQWDVRFKTGAGVTKNLYRVYFPMPGAGNKQEALGCLINAMLKDLGAFGGNTQTPKVYVFGVARQKGEDGATSVTPEEKNKGSFPPTQKGLLPDGDRTLLRMYRNEHK